MAEEVNSVVVGGILSQEEGTLSPAPPAGPRAVGQGERMRKGTLPSPHAQPHPTHPAHMPSHGPHIECLFGGLEPFSRLNLQDIEEGQPDIS